MGKGGESIVNVPKKFKLSHLSEDAVRKWGKAYGVKGAADMKLDSLLEELNPFADGILDPDRPANLPLELPTFTLKTIKDAIPSHCFERSLLRSLGHVLSDFALIAVLGYLATWIETPFLPAWARLVLWPIYWYAQGSVMTGVWVLAHECGHQSFSDSEFANNVFGTVLHSMLLVPYHSWRITHGRHHANTGSCENDEVFAPYTRADWGNEMLRETPLAQAWGIFTMLTIGWPGYLVLNATGPAKYRGLNANHFSPTAVFFEPKDFMLVVQSVSAWVIAVAAVVQAVRVFGAVRVAAYYGLPYMIVNYHLVLITFLQHTDVYMPHFRGSEWSWLRGALCTVDRSFGPLLDHTFHHIVDTHVCHHLFSKMPFYHAQEATEHIRRVLGPYYMKDDTPIARSTWRAFSLCQFVETEGSVVFYKNMK